MPIIRNDHLARARTERQMADRSASNIERIIHNQLADLHRAAGYAPLAAPVVDGGVA